MQQQQQQQEPLIFPAISTELAAQAFCSAALEDEARETLNQPGVTKVQLNSTAIFPTVCNSHEPPPGGFEEEEHSFFC